MKHLLNGVAIAAALAIAGPAWAQAPMTPSSSAAPKAAAPMAPMAPMATKQRHKRHHTMHMTRRGAGGSMADQLNREELARVQGGGGMPMGSGGVPGQPNPTAGIPGAGQPSASSHPGPH